QWANLRLCGTASFSWQAPEDPLLLSPPARRLHRNYRKDDATTRPAAVRPRRSPHVAAAPDRGLVETDGLSAWQMHRWQPAEQDASSSMGHRACKRLLERD